PPRYTPFPYTTLFRSSARSSRSRARIASRPSVTAAFTVLVSSLDTRVGERRAIVVRTVRVTQNEAPKPNPAPTVSQKIRLNTTRSEEHTSELQSPYDL